MSLLYFTAGKPWRRKAKGDPPDMDFSMCDQWVCPVYCMIVSEKRFILDVQADPSDIDPDHPRAPLAVEMRAGMVAAALNLALKNSDWARNLALVINPNVDHEELRMIEAVNNKIAPSDKD